MNIGYNIGKINELIDAVSSGYGNITAAIEENWSPLYSDFRDEWIGPDADSYISELGKCLNEVEKSCAEAIRAVGDNLQKIGEAWKHFQNQNTLEGAQITPITTEIKTIVIKESNGVPIPEARSFGVDEKLGLKSAGAAGILSGKITDYVNKVLDQVRNLYQNIEVNTAFFGEQAHAIQDYLDSVRDAVQNLIKCVDNINEALKGLVDQYSKQEAEVKSQVANQSSNINIAGKY